MLHSVFTFLAYDVFSLLFGLFMIRGDTTLLYVSCFTLLIDLYLLVIHDICLYFVMLANHDQNILVLFRFAQSMCFYIKLELSYCRIYCVNLPGSIDRELDSIDRK